MKTMKPVKLNPQFVVLVTVMIFLVLSSQFTANAQKNEAATPVASSQQPTSTIIYSPETYPFMFEPMFPPPDLQVDLYCNTQQLTLGETWNGIQIGRSSLADLEKVVTNLGTYPEISPIRYEGITTVTYSFEEVSHLPLWISACIEDDVVAMLLIQWLETDVELAHMVRQYGVYDTITWSHSFDKRVVFWFERGVAAEIFVGSGAEPYFGRLISTIYFVPQPVEGYAERFPYSLTHAEEHPVEWRQEALAEQNPFDLNTILATAVAMPSPTATPTLIPRTTNTQTPHPTQNSP
jgi:hypothetical protein